MTNTIQVSKAKVCLVLAQHTMKNGGKAARVTILVAKVGEWSH
jgi:hypothetical protein